MKKNSSTSSNKRTAQSIENNYSLILKNKISLSSEVFSNTNSLSKNRIKTKSEENSILSAGGSTSSFSSFSTFAGSGAPIPALLK